MASPYEMAVARAQVDEALNKVTAFLAHDEAVESELSAADRERLQRRSNEMVSAYLAKARRALQEFEEAAHGS